MIFARTIIDHEEAIIQSYKEANELANEAKTLEEQMMIWKRHAQKMGALTKAAKVQLILGYVDRIMERYDDYEITYRVLDDIFVKVLGHSISNRVLIDHCKEKGRPVVHNAGYHKNQDIRMEILGSDVIRELQIDYDNLETWLKGFKKMKTLNPEIKEILERDKRKREKLKQAQKKNPAGTGL